MFRLQSNDALDFVVRGLRATLTGSLILAFAAAPVSAQDEKKGDKPQQEGANEDEKKPADDEANGANLPLLVTWAKSKGDSLSTFVEALETAELVDELVNGGPFTVFIPGNGAFDQLKQPDVKALIKNRERDQLRELVKQHIVKGQLTSDVLLGLSTLRMESGRTFRVRIDGNAFTVGGAAIVDADHVCKNGVVHITDGVVLGETRPVMRMAKEEGRFWKFLDAAKAAGMAPMLTAPGDYTVFAPTDAAFAKVSSEDMSILGDPKNRIILLEMLRRHIVRGPLFSADLKKKSELRAMAGNRIPVATSKGVTTIGGAAIVVRDVSAANGVIHGIDQVFLPELPRDGKPRSAKADAAALIGSAIQSAVPLFNLGQADAVAALYQVACDSILKLGQPGIPEGATQAIESAIAEAAKAADGHDKAWELRKGMDKAFEVLTTP